MFVSSYAGGANKCPIADKSCYVQQRRKLRLHWLAAVVCSKKVTWKMGDKPPCCKPKGTEPGAATLPPSPVPPPR